MKTILLLSACYDEPHRTMGSAPKIARQLAKHARVVVFAGGSSDRVEDRSDNLRVYFVKEWLIPDPVNNGVVPGMLRKLRKVLDEEKPDAVLNLKYMFYPNLAVLYLKRKGYRVVTATDAFPGYSWFSASRIVNAVMWIWTRTIGKLVLKKSDKVVLFHEGLVEDAKTLGLDYLVIPNGVEMELVRSARKKKLQGKFVMLYVGRLESVKGYETILQAAQRLTQQFEHVHFYHVGDLEGKQAIVERYASQQMHFEGRKTLRQVYSYMKGSDVVVLASRSEGLPNVIIEGMACGCVPVSTSVGAVPYLLEDGRLGRLVPYQDVDALVKAVASLYEHPQERKAIAAKAKKKVLAEYDWKNLAERYFEVLCAE